MGIFVPSMGIAALEPDRPNRHHKLHRLRRINQCRKGTSWERLAGGE